MQLQPLKPGPQYCRWLWQCITVLCDGRVTCGLDDPQGRAVYGDARTSTIREVMAGPAARMMRERLLAGGRCSATPCALSTALPDAPPAPLALPLEAVIEPTIRCNLRCANPTCEINNDSRAAVRESDFLDVDLFRRIIDEVGPGLRVLHFYNYGEPFLHPRAIEMLRHARNVQPDLLIACASNGVPLAESHLAAAVVELASQIYVSISGVTTASYTRYQGRIQLDRALKGLENLTREKARRKASQCAIVWRYLVFNWNDSDEEIEQAKSLARSMGVDRLVFTLTAYPWSSRSTRRAPGAQGFEIIKEMSEYACGYEEQVTRDEGLYDKEVSASLGVFQWTGRKARIEVFARSEHVVLRLAALRPAELQFPTVRITTPWEKRLGWVGDQSWADNDLHVGAEGVNTLVPIEIDVSSTWIPARDAGVADTRELGVTVSLGPDPF